MQHILYIYKALMATAAIASLASCVKDPLYDTTHPDTGSVAVTAEWPDCNDKTGVPDRWNMTLGDYRGEETGKTHTPDYLFTPGEYTLLTWNPTRGITVDGSTATAIYDAGNCIEWFFADCQKVTIERDHDHILTATMRQLVRKLTIEMDIEGDAADRITGIKATLSGVAGSLDFATDSYGKTTDINLVFTKNEETGKWVATVRLLGVADGEQHLNGTITFADGNPQDLTFDSNLTKELIDFNTGKTVPITLSGKVIETATGADVTATIEKWEVIDNNNVDAF